MGKRSAQKPVIKTTLTDLLAQKHVPSPDRHRMELLEREKVQLEEDVIRLKGIIERLQKQGEKDSTVPDTDADSLFRRAVRELKKARPLDALGFLCVLLWHHPGHIKAMTNTAVVYANLGFTQQAEQILRNVLDMDPDNELARKNLNMLMEID